MSSFGCGPMIGAKCKVHEQIWRREWSNALQVLAPWENWWNKLDLLSPIYHAAVSWRPPAGGWGDISCENTIQFWIWTDLFIWTESHSLYFSWGKNQYGQTILASHLPFSIAVYNHNTCQYQDLRVLKPFRKSWPTALVAPTSKRVNASPDGINVCMNARSAKMSNWSSEGDDVKSEQFT